MSTEQEKTKPQIKTKDSEETLADEPSEEELAKEYKDWDMASDTEKILLKETYITKQWRAKIADAGKQATKIEKWNDSVEAFTEDPQTLIDIPELEGKTEAFKKFATTEENNSIPMNLKINLIKL